jgi:hypothetical protein
LVEHERSSRHIPSRGVDGFVQRALTSFILESAICRHNWDVRPDCAFKSHPREYSQRIASSVKLASHVMSEEGGSEAA